MSMFLGVVPCSSSSLWPARETIFLYHIFPPWYSVLPWAEIQWRQLAMVPKTSYISTQSKAKALVRVSMRSPGSRSYSVQSWGLPPGGNCRATLLPRGLKSRAHLSTRGSFSQRELRPPPKTFWAEYYGLVLLKMKKPHVPGHQRPVAHLYTETQIYTYTQRYMHKYIHVYT